MHPVIVAVGGPVASGKSTLARELASRLGAEVLEADAVRDELAEDRRAATVHEADWHALGEGFAERVYAELLRRAEDALDGRRSTVLDACFPAERWRRRARAVARSRGARFLFVECRTPDAAVRARLAARDARAERPGWQALHDALVARFEPVTELATDEHRTVASEGPLGGAVASLVETLRPHARLRVRERPPRPAAVTFDCWNTLLAEEDWPAAHAIRVAELRAAAREAGREVPLEDAGRAFDAAWERHMRMWRQGEATGAREVALSGLAELGLREPHPALEHLVRAFEEASHSGRVAALAGARETLEALAAARIPCALVCDTGLTPGREVRRHLERLGLLAGLAAQSFSDEVGVPKPDPRAFRAALGPLGAPPERSLHVGDLRRTDVAGARGLGMWSVRIRDRHDDRSELPEADFVVASHAELRELLRV